MDDDHWDTPLDLYSTSNDIQSEFWNETILDDYKFLMSEELISHCKNSLIEPFCSYNDLILHHVSYNEFEKQFLEFSDWCAKNLHIITTNSSNTLTCYLRQKWYEDLYEQGAMRARTFNQYAKKLIERFPELQLVIEEKRKKMSSIWMEVEGCLIRYFDEDFDQILEELHNELIRFEQWINDIEDQLVHIQDFDQVLKLQNEIKSKNTSVSSLLEICERLKTDYKPQLDRIPFDYANDLETHWHQIWIYSLEIQCKFEEQRSQQYSSSDDEDIIPFNSSEYEKISLTSSDSTDIDQSIFHRKRRRSTGITNDSMGKFKRCLSLNPHPPICYYSLTNIDDDDEQRLTPRKKFKKTSSKLDIGYASDGDIHSFSSFHYQSSWEYSITSAYETCSNFNETKKISLEPSLSIYRKKYLTSPVISHSYDASVEYTDGDQSDNDLDISTSIPIHHYGKGESLYYNRYATTTTTGYSSDIEQNSSDDQPLMSSIHSEPCWDGYQNPLYTPEIDSMESPLKWDEQFLEMDPSLPDLHEHNPVLITCNEQQFESDSDMDDLNDVINQTDRQLLKTKQNLAKKKSRGDERIHDELVRTCQTNIQCLETILNNLHQSTHSRLHNTRVVQLFQTYLSHWYEMREEVNVDRHQHSQLNERIARFEHRLNDEYSRFDQPIHSLIELHDDLLEQFKSDERTRHELSHLINDYHFICPDGPFNEHFILNQLSTRMDQYQIQLRTLFDLIEKLLPIENELEQKLITSIDYPIDLLEFQNLIDLYAQLIPSNILQNYCQSKLKTFRQHLIKSIRNQPMNFNNNNSSHPTDEQRISRKKFSCKEIGDLQEDFTSSLPQTSSSTSSYISDDCKVLYIETIIEVNKPVFYERTNYISETMNSHSIDNHNSSDSTDGELSYHGKSSRPEDLNDDEENSSPRLDDAMTKNSSSIPRSANQNGFLFPATNRAFEETSRPTLAHRMEQQRVFERTHQRTRPYRRILLRPPPTIRNRWKEYLPRALKIGLLILLPFLIIYLYFLDQCSRSRIFRDVARTVIRIERDGPPLI